MSVVGVLERVNVLSVLSGRVLSGHQRCSSEDVIHNIGIAITYIPILCCYFGKQPTAQVV